ncbi:MAG: hypothetical protein HKL84_06840 [Acidimicrobiaceae bacterium]|nr:hypothetical protein [Acidimicrobiaceae bacterium]
MRGLSFEQRKWLLRAQEIGFIGPKPVESVYEHALGFAECIDELLRTGQLPSSFIAADLGSGAGVPGLLLAEWFPDSSFLLIDSMRKRYLFLEDMTSYLGLGSRVQVFPGRSEECAHLPEFRLGFDLVTARGFALPSATAENASGLLSDKGILLVSEPPNTSSRRWSVEGLDRFGFSPPTFVRFKFSYCWMVKDHSERGKFPRGTGIPEKFPLF